MAVDVAQCECSNIKCYALAFSNILICYIVVSLIIKLLIFI